MSNDTSNTAAHTSDTHMTDDMLDPELCEQCSGGIVEECDRCLALKDVDANERDLDFGPTT